MYRPWPLKRVHPMSTLIMPLDTLTRGLALEVAKEGIRVNGVRPGLISTQMHSDGGEPQRVTRLQDKIPMGRGSSR